MIPPKTRGRRLRRLALLVLALSALGEVGVRLAEQQLAATGSLYSLVVERKSERFRLQSNADLTVPERYGDVRYRLNQKGYRDIDRGAVPRGRPSRRLLVLGDSVSFGLGVDQALTYPSRLERKLEEFRPPYEVANLAIFAYHTLDELATFEEDGRELLPEVTILQFYWNDLTLRNVVPDPVVTPPPPSFRLRLTAAWNRLAYRSALYRRLNQLFDGVTYRAIHDVRRERFPESLNDDQIRTDTEYLDANPDDASIPTFVAIERVSAAVAASGSRFLVLLSPDEVQLFRTDYDRSTERVRRFLDSRGIAYFDPLPSLRAREDRARLFHDGVHYSPLGHEVLAQLLAEELTRRGFVHDLPRDETLR